MTGGSRRCARGGYAREEYTSRLREKGKAYRRGGWSVKQPNDIRHITVCFELLVQKLQCSVAYRRTALSPEQTSEFFRSLLVAIRIVGGDIFPDNHWEGSEKLGRYLVTFVYLF